MSTEVAVPEPADVAVPTSAAVAVPDARLERFQRALAAEQGAEREMAMGLVSTILVSVPIMVGIFVLMMAIAISDKTDWYVWLSLGVGLGIVGAGLLGSLAGATRYAHKLDEVDRMTFGLEPGAH